MKKRDYRDYLHDLLDSMKDIEDFVGNMTYEDFIEDKKTINAVVRSIEIIGEATKNLPTSFRNEYSSVPWRKMAGMRDRLAHEYFDIDMEILWQVIKKDIVSLEPKIRQILERIS
jgi:uncharacterized protein with HEPN domain